MSFSFSNENLVIAKENTESKKQIPLLYFFKNNVTSQDPLYPLNNLLDKSNKKGWISNRFCIYPQEIIVEFHSLVNIKQINILINESKIPTVIEIVNCVVLPNDTDIRGNPNKVNYQYTNIGFIRLSSNIETCYKARELRRIYVNLFTKRIKLIIHKNYSNLMNTFCQVGIVSLDFFGFILPSNEKYQYKTKLKQFNYADISLDEEIQGLNDSFFEKRIDKKTEIRLKELKEEMEKKKASEEYDDCKVIKKEIDQLKKLTFKIYNLEMYKNECVKRFDFDNAKKIKKDLDIFKKILSDYINKSEGTEIEEDNNKIDDFIYLKEGNNTINPNDNIILNNNEENKQNNEKKLILNKKLKLTKMNQENLNMSGQKIDDIVLPTLQRKLNNNINKISNINNNSFDNNTINSSGHFDSIIGINENEPIEREPLEASLPSDIKTKYEMLETVLGEEVIRKLFSKHTYYKEEGLDALNAQATNIIIDDKKSTQEANKYIVSLINLFFCFFEEKHPSIICKCLELFLNILKAIKERSSANKTEYDFKITKPILKKIKNKLSHISKKVRLKASELYIYMLNSDFCEFNSLITELIENEVNGYYIKLEKLNNNLNFSFQLFGGLGLGNVYSLNLSKQLMVTKMKIILEILSNEENNKIDKKKFPQNLVEDFIIMNVNHPKEEVRDITKAVLIKYMDIFGNQILYKLKNYIDYKELMKLFQDKEELKQPLLKIKEEENKKKVVKINYSNLLDITKNRNYQKLNPIQSNNSSNNNYLRNKNKKLTKSSSVPKYYLSNKIKLKPINNNSNNSQNDIVVPNLINNNDKKKEKDNAENNKDSNKNNVKYKNNKKDESKNQEEKA